MIRNAHLFITFCLTLKLDQVHSVTKITNALTFKISIRYKIVFVKQCVEGKGTLNKFKINRSNEKQKKGIIREFIFTFEHIALYRRLEEGF